MAKKQIEGRIKPCFEEPENIKYTLVEHDKIVAGGMASILYQSEHGLAVLMLEQRIKEARERLEKYTSISESIASFEDRISYPPTDFNILAANSFVARHRWLREGIIRTFTNHPENNDRKHGITLQKSSAAVVGFCKDNSKSFWAMVPKGPAFICVLDEGYFKGDRADADKEAKQAKKVLRGLKMFHRLFATGLRDIERYRRVDNGRE